MIKFKDIKIVVLDVDGVLTDGKYVISTLKIPDPRVSSEIEPSEQTYTDITSISKSFFTRDFYAIEQLLKNDINVIILSQSHDNVIFEQINRICLYSDNWKSWMKKEKISIINGVEDKVEAIDNYFIHNSNVDSTDGHWKSIAYMGDAENDIECLKLALYTGCPSDAIEEVKTVINYPSYRKGGEGAVYEFIMYILEKRKL